MRLQFAGTVKLETAGQTWPCLRCKMFAGLFILFHFVNNCTDESVSNNRERARVSSTLSELDGCSSRLVPFRVAVRFVDIDQNVA